MFSAPMMQEIDERVPTPLGGRTERGRSREVNAIVGASAAMKTVLQQVGMVAPTDATVLILGDPQAGSAS